MRCTVKAIQVIKSYIKKDGQRFLGGYQLYLQDYPLGPVITIFTKQHPNVQEGDHMYVTSVVKKDNTMYWRLMDMEEVELEEREMMSKK